MIDLKKTRDAKELCGGGLRVPRLEAGPRLDPARDIRTDRRPYEMPFLGFDKPGTRFIDNIAGLELAGIEIRRRFDKVFLPDAPLRQGQILAAIAAAEPKPKMALGHFFARLKLMTVEGYYASGIGIHREPRN